MLAACYSGDVARGRSAFSSRCGSSAGRSPTSSDRSRSRPGRRSFDPLLTPGMRNYWKSHDFLDVSDGLIDVLVDFARQLPDAHTEISFAQLGGAINRRAVARRHSPAATRSIS